MTGLLMVVLVVALTALAQSPQARGLGQASQASAAAQTAGAPATGSKAPASAPPAKGPAAPASKSPEGGPGEKRDPFVSTIQVDKAGQMPMPECPPGVRGIIVGQAELTGVVQTSTAMIAVITTSNTGRTYFLREDTALCNGRVVRITPDSIVFEENVLDLGGKAQKREVIKKIPAEAF